MINKYFKNKNLWFILVFILQAFVLQAQCDITNFTATPAAGACIQDASIDIQITAATDCAIVPTFAEVFLAGTTTALELITVAINGEATFSNLTPGTYDVVVRQGNESSTQENISVTSTYTPMTVIAEGVNTSCSLADSNNPANGSASVTVTGAVGPFTYNLIIGGSVQETEGPTTATSHSFTNLAPGAYNVSVTDNNPSCTSGETRSVTIAETINNPLVYYYERSRPDEDTCGLVTYRIAARFGNSSGLGRATAASATLNGGATIYGDVESNGSTTSYYDFKGLTPGDVLSNIQVSDICNSVSRPDLIIPILPEDYLDYTLEASKSDECTATLNINIDAGITSGVPDGRTAFAFQVTSSLSILKEEPAGSGTFVLIETRLNSSKLSTSGGSEIFIVDDPIATYKIVAEDDCHTVERIIVPDVTFENPLFKIGLKEGPSILEGTSSIYIQKTTDAGTLTIWSSTEPLSYPITATITRTDGSSNITTSPSQPYSLGGAYSYDFPMTAVFEGVTDKFSLWYSTPIIGNLPLGEYEVLFIDACGDSITQTINLTAPTAYDPSITFKQGCAAADIVFEMNGVNVVDLSKTSLYENNAGALGPLVRDFTENPSNSNTGQFSTIAPGDYFMQFDDLRFRQLDSRGYNVSINFDAALNAFERIGNHQVAVTVPVYEQVTFSTVSFFCDVTDDTSGIMGIIAIGVPVGSTTFSIWESTLNPETDLPTQTYTTTDLTELEHVFQNLNVGTYIIRVINDCGFSQETKTIEQGPFNFPETDPDTLKMCAGDTFPLSIALPNILFDFSWTDSSGAVIGTANSIEVSPTQTEIFTVYYSLKPSFGCSNSPEGPYELEMTVFESIKLSSDPTTTCSEDNASYSVSFELIGEAPFTAVSGTGTPGTWEGNVWTSDAIAVEENYNVSVADANECFTLFSVTGLAPSDCIDAELECFKINNLFTPHAVDGINDFFTIDCIENFPNSKLEIYNRWGVLVYEATNYLNTWDGESAGRATIGSGNKVPAGTYYYILDLGIITEEPLKGWLFLN